MDTSNIEEIILSADVINHYINKLYELTDDIASIRNQLEAASQITEINWAGESGQASLAVINKFNEKFRGINGSLSEAVNLFSGMIVEEE